MVDIRKIQSHGILGLRYLVVMLLYNFNKSIGFSQKSHLRIIILDRAEEIENGEDVDDEDDLYDYHGT